MLWNMLIPIHDLLLEEERRQAKTISLIASENIASAAVREAMSSVLTNKYAEGYPGRRYYAGCEVADKIETRCIELAKQVFEATWANVQPHSGSQANFAVFLALLQPGDTILSLALEAGGHLTHGAKISATSKFYNVVHYGLNEHGIIDLEEVEKLAKQYKPRLIITGASAYSQLWPWQEFRRIADEHGAYLMADVAHTAGLIAGKAHENPITHVDVMTMTTHKTLRGPRGGLIVSNNAELGAKIDRAVFPGIQGGPLMNAIAAKAIGFEENLDPEFEIYASNVIKNAKILAQKFINVGAKLLSGGTENHLMIVDMKSFGLTGKEAEELLYQAGISVSVSALPGESWQKPSAIRIGTPYVTTLGVDVQELAELVIEALQTKKIEDLRRYSTNASKRFLKQNIINKSYSDHETL
jgi:glycine hydroxymethyltransferase